jgi:hypothetical protein
MWSTNAQHPSTASSGDNDLALSQQQLASSTTTTTAAGPPAAVDLRMAALAAAYQPGFLPYGAAAPTTRTTANTTTTSNQNKELGASAAVNSYPDGSSAMFSYPPAAPWTAHGSGYDMYHPYPQHPPTAYGLNNNNNSNHHNHHHLLSFHHQAAEPSLSLPDDNHKTKVPSNGAWNGSNAVVVVVPTPPEEEAAAAAVAKRPEAGLFTSTPAANSHHHHQQRLSHLGQLVYSSRSCFTPEHASGSTDGGAVFIQPRGKPEAMALALAAARIKASQQEELEDEEEEDVSDKDDNMEVDDTEENPDDDDDEVIAEPVAEPDDDDDNLIRGGKRLVKPVVSKRAAPRHSPLLLEPAQPMTGAEYENLEALMVQFCRVPLLAEFSRPVTLLHPEVCVWVCVCLYFCITFVSLAWTGSWKHMYLCRHVCQKQQQETHSRIVYCCVGIVLNE